MKALKTCQYNMRYIPRETVSPPMIYCDFKRGFYSLDGKFLQRFDGELRYQPLECTCVTDYNPCTRGQFPIPNGTCLFPCEEGFERDVHDGFQCKELRRAETDSSLEEMKPKDNDLSQKAEEADEINIINKTSQKPRNETKTEDSRTSNDSHVTIVIVFVFAALLFAIVGLVLYILSTKTA
ncbi:uncharacterized protein LOC128558193 [Mercenaria mercenaria]|uniref:uncharacterized protein LOC128558193 n=1 Tax=Mercenaria mercenaria TaxID=6596 RepID=UPI00234EC348|nr:uncharacterized protein LOC128558193 [Mercenaria mercenaria]